MSFIKYSKTLNTNKIELGWSCMPINPLIVIMSCRKNSHLWNNLKNCDKTCIIFCGDPSLKTDYVYN